MADVLTCANHPNKATVVRCSKCGKPICPACVIETPVGLRCRECAQLRRLPVFQVSPLQYLLAMGTAVGLGLVVGVGWHIILVGFRFLGGILSFFIALGVGYIMGELVSLAVNRKRGIGLQVLVGVGVFVAFLFSGMSFDLLFVSPTFAFATAARFLFSPFTLLALAVAIYIGASRVG